MPNIYLVSLLWLVIIRNMNRHCQERGGSWSAKESQQLNVYEIWWKPENCEMEFHWSFDINETWLWDSRVETTVPLRISYALSDYQDYLEGIVDE